MQVEYERTGGFTGMRVAASFDLRQLQPTEAEQVQRLVEEAGFQKLPENIQGDSAIPDQFTYKISITADKWSHTVVATDDSLPDQLQPLVELLTQLARQPRG
jgi:hypothetical protein